MYKHAHRTPPRRQPMSLFAFHPPAWDELGEWLDVSEDASDDVVLQLALEHTHPEVLSSYPPRLVRNNAAFLTHVVRRMRAASDARYASVHARRDPSNPAHALWFTHRFSKQDAIVPAPTLDTLAHAKRDDGAWMYWDYHSTLTESDGSVHRTAFNAVEGDAVARLTWHFSAVSACASERGTLVWWDDPTNLQNASSAATHAFKTAGFRVVDVHLMSAVMHYRAALAYVHVVELPTNPVWRLLRQQTMDASAISAIGLAICRADPTASVLFQREDMLSHFEAIVNLFFDIETPIALLVQNIDAIFYNDRLDDARIAALDTVPSIDRAYELLGLATTFERSNGLRSKLIGFSCDPFSSRGTCIRLAMLCGVASAYPDWNNEAYLDASDETVTLSWTNRLSRHPFPSPLREWVPLSIATYTNQIRGSPVFCETRAAMHWIRKGLPETPHVVCVATAEARTETLRALAEGGADVMYTSIDSLEDAKAHPSCRIFVIVGEHHLGALDTMDAWHVHVFGGARPVLDAHQRAMRGVRGATLHAWRVSEHPTEHATRDGLDTAMRAVFDEYIHTTAILHTAALECVTRAPIVQVGESPRAGGQTDDSKNTPSASRSIFSHRHGGAMDTALAAADALCASVPVSTMVHIQSASV